MRMPLIVPFAIAACFGAATLPALAADAKAPKAAQEKGEGHEKGEELEHLMSKMGKAVKNLKKNVALADKKDSNIADFNTIAELSKKSKAFVPPTANTDELKKKYAEMLDNVVDAAEDGAKASAEGKLADAQTSYDEIKKLQKEGHRQFMKEDKH